MLVSMLLDCTIISPSLAILTFSLKKRNFPGKVTKFFVICCAFYINNVPQNSSNIPRYQSRRKGRGGIVLRRDGWKIPLLESHAESHSRNFRSGRQPSNRRFVPTTTTEAMGIFFFSDDVNSCRYTPLAGETYPRSSFFLLPTSNRKYDLSFRSHEKSTIIFLSHRHSVQF